MQYPNPDKPEPKFCRLVQDIVYKRLRACLKSAFRQMCATVCERFAPNEGGVVGHRPRMRGKDLAK